MTLKENRTGDEVEDPYSMNQQDDASNCKVDQQDDASNCMVDQQDDAYNCMKDKHII
jgi:hypothetical protein